MPRAAPVRRTDALTDDIIGRVSEGVPLALICREDGMPHVSTFYDWLNDDTELDRRFARAREIGHDAIAARTRLIARGEEGSSKDIKRDRLIVDTDLKLLEKWDRRYRPSQVLSGDPDAPLGSPTEPGQIASSIASILDSIAKRDAGDLA